MKKYKCISCGHEIYTVRSSTDMATGIHDFNWSDGHRCIFADDKGELIKTSKENADDKVE